MNIDGEQLEKQKPLSEYFESQGIKLTKLKNKKR